MSHDNKKKAIHHVVIAILGLLLGFIGVFLSVFSDGSTYERIVTILIVLIIYGIIGIATGIWKPVAFSYFGLKTGRSFKSKK